VSGENSNDSMTDELNTVQAQLMIEELVRCRVETFCICPGSRSTPLVAAAARNPRARTTMFYDERGAAFYALGYARSTNRPAAVITTSGTGVANLMPAVAEASVDKVPLLALTADRPTELTDTGANQTLNQASMFGRYVRWTFDMPSPSRTVIPEAVLTTIDQAVSRCVGTHPGPVHLNCRFREPLEPTNVRYDAQYESRIRMWRESSCPFTTYETATAATDQAVMQSIAEMVGTTQRGLIVIGGLRDSNQQQTAKRLAEKLAWPVYADITSGLRLSGCGTNLIRHYDPQLLDEQFDEHARADVVLHIGGRTTSKRLGQFLDRNRPKSYIVVKNDPDRYDPIHAVTHHVQADIASFCRALADSIEPRENGALAEFYQNKASTAQAIIEEHVNAEPALTEAFVARHLSRTIAEATGLFVSNSMPIRDMDLYSDAATRMVMVDANRGISGIDGIVASACGFAAGLDAAVTAVVGDVALIHDINSLGIVGRSAQPVIVITINNHGGGIFDFLGISRHEDVFEEYFVTPHDYSFAGACETFGVTYRHTTTKQAFIKAYSETVAAGTSAVIEVETDRKVNLKLRKNMKMAIIEALKENS